MSQMQTKIAAQLAIIRKQKNRIEAIKFYLKRKGEDYEKDDLEGKITFDTDKAKESLQIASLDNLVREVDHQETWQKVSDISPYATLRTWRYYPGLSGFSSLFFLSRKGKEKDGGQNVASQLVRLTFSPANCRPDPDLGSSNTLT